MSDNTASHPNSASSPPGPADDISGASNDASADGAHPKRRRPLSGAASTSSAASGGSGGRSVASLTPEQLARKRANDRAAQRAIRERTRNQIDALQARIRALESQRPHQEVQRALREKDAVVAENEEIRRRLESVMEIIRPVLGERVERGIETPARAAGSVAVTGPRGDTTPLHRSKAHDEALDLAQSRGVSTPVSDVHAVYGNGHRSSPSQDGPFHHSLPGIPPTSNMRALREAESPQLDQPRNVLTPGFEYDTPAERLRPDVLMDRSKRFATHPDTALPRHTESTCPLDTLILDCLAERREQLAEGVPPKAVMGPPYPSFTTLVSPERDHSSHRLSKILTDILRTFPDISRLPDQIAVLHSMYLVLRWLVVPSKETYDRVPEWLRPTPSQLLIHHAAWMDFVPWPGLRDRLVESPVEFDAFFVPYTTTFSVNWPYGPSDCLLPVAAVSAVSSPVPHDVPSAHLSQTLTVNAPEDQPNELWRLNPVFETHIHNLANWSLGPAFRDAFPDKADTVRIKDS